MRLFGRESERAALAKILDDARAGRSQALLIVGEAGIGKTALLDEVAESAEGSGFAVARVVGHEAEQQFAYAGIHRLCAPFLGHLDALPDPQRDALEVALGLSSGSRTDIFLVGLAVLTLLAESAEERPLLCLVDDALWLDAASAQVIAFVARRISAERLALIITGRELDSGQVAVFSGIPSITVRGLGDADARSLLATAVRTPLDDALRERLVAEAHGNPLALLELPRSLAATQLARGLAVPESGSTAGLVQTAYLDRYAALASGTRMLVLAAAAEPTGDPMLLWAAAAKLGVTAESATPAESAGLLEIGSSVLFAHPLARSAVYSGSPAADRRRVHEALAEVTDPLADPDRRAWHRGLALLRPEEEVAAESEAAALRALERGGMADAAAFLERATELTPDATARAGRALMAAQAAHEAGDSDRALRLLTLAQSGPLDALAQARARLYRAMIVFDQTANGDEAAAMADAARDLAPLDVVVSREAYLLAINSTTRARVDAGAPSVRKVAAAAREAPLATEPSEPADLLLDALVVAYTRDLATASPQLERALEAFRRSDPDDDDHDRRRRTGRWLALAARTAVAMFDYDLARMLVSRNVERVRSSGSLASLPGALVELASVLVLSGELAQAADLTVESEAVARAAGIEASPLADLFLAAWRGRESDTNRLDDLARHSLVTGGARAGIVQYALAVSRVSRGDYAGAADAAILASHADELVVASLALPELVEAASRAGRVEEARQAADRLGDRTSACDSVLAQGLAAYGRALVSDDPEDHYREAIRVLGDTCAAGYLARAHLVYGEWLRRRGRRQSAREHLHVAYESFGRMGAEIFADRAARELRATGEHPRARGAGPGTSLTDHELHIARLVASGSTAREVAAELFLSPRTIEAHLRNIYRKLGITSRRQLRELLS